MNFKYVHIFSFQYYIISPYKDKGNVQNVSAYYTVGSVLHCSIPVQNYSAEKKMRGNSVVE